MFSLDLGQFVVSIVAAWSDAKTAHAWMRLVFSMIFSGVIAYYGAAGAALISGTSELLAKGYGYLAVAVSLLSVFVASPLTRGMMISIPQSVVKRLHEQAAQTTIRRE